MSNLLALLFIICSITLFVLPLPLPGLVTPISTPVSVHNGGGCGCDEGFTAENTSRLVDQDEYQPYQTRRGDTVAQAEAALEEIKALGKFSRTNLSRLEKVMRDILQGANTGELARVAALSPCRSWYYLLFGLAILIEADVLLTVKQIVYICQNW